MRSYQPLFTELPPTRLERWDRLAEFAAFWHGVDCSAIDYTRPALQTETRLHVTLPRALVEWYERFSRFINLWSDRSFTLPINRIRIEDRTLILRSESIFNGIAEAKWGIPLVDIESDDPNVVCMLGSKHHLCAHSVSEFAIHCAMFDTINKRHAEEIPCENEIPFPAEGKKACFPESFGVIKTEMYEGTNWIALVSGTDWYVRQREPETGTDRFIKHELRTEGLPP